MKVGLPRFCIPKCDTCNACAVFLVARKHFATRLVLNQFATWDRNLRLERIPPFGTDGVSFGRLGGEYKIARAIEWANGVW